MSVDLCNLIHQNCIIYYSNKDKCECRLLQNQPESSYKHWYISLMLTNNMPRLIFCYWFPHKCSALPALPVFLYSQPFSLSNSQTTLASLSIHCPQQNPHNHHHCQYCTKTPCYYNPRRGDGGQRESSFMLKEVILTQKIFLFQSFSQFFIPLIIIQTLDWAEINKEGGPFFVFLFIISESWRTGHETLPEWQSVRRWISRSQVV